jgi:hypothetical protein
MILPAQELRKVRKLTAYKKMAGQMTGQVCRLQFG